MALPKEPRQKMINIMYLVLTALLAINISAEILNAFKTIDNSLKKTNGTIYASTDAILNSLKEKMGKPETREKATTWAGHADKVVNESKSVYDFIEQLKKDLIKEAGGDPNSKEPVFKEDDQDAATRLFVNSDKGKQLFSMLESYKKNLLAIDPKIAEAFATSLPIDLQVPKTQDNKNWQEAYFYMAPSVGALSILSKFQNDIRTSENKVTTFCHEQVGKVEFVVDTYSAIVGQSSNYVMPGQPITVNAGIGAYSKNAAPTISIGGAGVALGDEGFASREITAGGPGTYSIPVKISYTDQLTNERKEVSRNIEYTVGSPGGASVALDKMNVLYIGVPNPVTIASSTGWDKTKVTYGGGGISLAGNNGKYVANVTSQTDDCTITVTSDGKPSVFKFRVRNVPEAQAYVGGQQSGTSIAAGAFRAQPGVGAGIKNFPFELSYDVVSYTFTCDTDDDIVSIPAQGAAFNGAVRSAISQHVKADRTVTIDDIKVKGPDGRIVKAPSLVYYIK